MAPSVSLALNCSNNSVVSDVFFCTQNVARLFFFSTFYEILTQNPCLHSTILFERYEWNRKIFCILSAWWNVISVLLDFYVFNLVYAKKAKKKKEKKRKKKEKKIKKIAIWRIFFLHKCWNLKSDSPSIHIDKILFTAHPIPRTKAHTEAKEKNASFEWIVVQ